MDFQSPVAAIEFRLETSCVLIVVAFFEREDNGAHPVPFSIGARIENGCSFETDGAVPAKNDSRGRGDAFGGSLRFDRLDPVDGPRVRHHVYESVAALAYVANALFELNEQWFVTVRLAVGEVQSLDLPS
jgi:hypothetical protein